MAEVKVTYRNIYPLESVQLTLTPEEAFAVFLLVGSVVGGTNSGREYSSNVFNQLAKIFSPGNGGVYPYPEFKGDREEFTKNVLKSIKEQK